MIKEIDNINKDVDELSKIMVRDNLEELNIPNKLILKRQSLEIKKSDNEVKVAEIDANKQVKIAVEGKNETI